MMKKLAVTFLIALLVVSLFGSCNAKIFGIIAEVKPDEKVGITPDITSVLSIECADLNYVALKAEKYIKAYPSAEYAQLKLVSDEQASGDMFISPNDKNITDDYNFSSLIECCKALTKVGVKPFIEFCGIPRKFCSAESISQGGMNIAAPDDFSVYYAYIYAMGSALVKEFGASQVLTWRFGCASEFGSSDVFANESSTLDFCAVYDYTQKALSDSVGDDVFFGVHGVKYNNGQLNCNIFIKHCAEGENSATGETGTPVSFLTLSYYEEYFGKENEYTITQALVALQNTVWNYGIRDLLFGVEACRIHKGDSSGSEGDYLPSGELGFSSQAAYNARIYKQLLEAGGSWIASRIVIPESDIGALPSIGDNFRSQFSSFSASKIITVNLMRISSDEDSEADCFGCYNKSSNSLRLMAYNYKSDLSYKNSARFNFEIELPFEARSVSVTLYRIDDDCNYFDEWLTDRKKYNISDSNFVYSPDDPSIFVNTAKFPKGFSEDAENLCEKYKAAGDITSVTQKYEVTDGKFSFIDTVAANCVTFYVIESSDMD